MIVLKCVAPKANGLSSGSWFYVAAEEWREDGTPYATITKNPARAMRFPDRESAEEFNHKMVQIGNFAKPFQIQEIK